MASGNQFISQSPGKILRTKKRSNGGDQISDECCVSCMILLVLLFWGTFPEHRITAVENEVERSVGTLTATILKIHRPPLDQAFTPMTLASNLLAQTQPAQALPRKTGNYKRTFPIKQFRLPLVNLLDTSQISTKIETLKRRGWPKLKRLGRAVQRNSRRISRLRAHLSFLQAELEEWTSSRDVSTRTTLCKQELTENEFSPGRMYLVGSFLVQYYLQKWNEEPIDGNRVNIPGLIALSIDQFPCLRA